MKYLLILLLFASCKAQTLTDIIPSNYVGTWTNASNTDTIFISEDRITFTSNQNDTVVDFVDIPTHINTNSYVFSSRPTLHYITLNKITRNKITFFVQDQYGLTIANDTYLKSGVRINVVTKLAK